jgi:hypothetical protein
MAGAAGMDVLNSVLHWLIFSFCKNFLSGLHNDSSLVSPDYFGHNFFCPHEFAIGKEG